MPNINNAAIVPSSNQAIADKGGFVTTAWQRFFNTLVSPAAPLQSVTVLASPFAYTAGQAGSLAVSGGTVSAISLTRSGTTIPTGMTGGTLSLANGDTVTITYAVAPTVNFIPA